MLEKESIDSVNRVKQLAYGKVVVEGVHNVSAVFGKVNLAVPFSFKKLRHSVNEVGGEYFVEHSVCISLVKLFKSVAEETESSADENSVCLEFLKLGGNFNHRVARRDHIVNDDNILALDVGAEEFVGDNGVSALDDF